MKLKTFGAGSKAETISLHVLGGGYDPEVQRVVLVVRSDNDSVGSIAFDVAEARRIAGMLIADTPEVTRVPVVAVDSMVTKGERE